MTKRRALEIERKVIYGNIENIMCALKDCENSNVVFNVGRYLGMLQRDLLEELEKEAEEQE